MRALHLLAVLLLPLASAGQDTYRLQFKIEGLNDTTIYLAYFFHEKTYVKDTARASDDGSFVFTGQERLPEGVYLLILNNARLFDFVVGADQEFSLTTVQGAYPLRTAVSGDEDNALFLKNMVSNAGYSKETAPLVEIVRDSTATESAKAGARAGLQEINQKAIAAQELIIQQSPGSVTARLLLMNKPIDVPDPPKGSHGAIDSTYYLRYYRAHYFDHFNLGDELMLRTPKVFYWDKVNDYLSRLFIQHPDTLTAQIHHLGAIAKANPETYKYFIWKCITEFHRPEIMGLDEVYVNLVDKYVTTGEMDYWLDKRTIANLKTQADEIRRAMIGRKAPNLIMLDMNLQPRALYDIRNKYTIVYYFSTQCGHCREQTPKLVAFYESAHEKFGFDVYAVAADTSMQDIRDFASEFHTPWTTVCGPRTLTRKAFAEDYYAYSTPTVYVLDQSKKVIARHLPVTQLGDFLLQHENMIRRRREAHDGAGG